MCSKTTSMCWMWMWRTVWSMPVWRLRVARLAVGRRRRVSWPLAGRAYVPSCRFREELICNRLDMAICELDCNACCGQNDGSERGMACSWSAVIPVVSLARCPGGRAPPPLSRWNDRGGLSHKLRLHLQSSIHSQKIIISCLSTQNGEWSSNILYTTICCHCSKLALERI